MIIRLVGIDTPRNSLVAKVDVLSQMQQLRRLIGVGDQVCLETEDGAKTNDRGHVLAHVHRASDGLWLNLELAEQGFATIPATYVSRAQPALAAAEGRARDAGRGIWAPDYGDHAVQPTPFRAPKPKPRPIPPRRSRTPTAPTIMQVPVPVPMPFPVAGGSSGYNGGYGSPSR